MKAPSKAEYYRGVRMAPYDLIKEVSVAMLLSLVVIVVLSAILSSPDVPSATIQSWAKADPVDFVTTATAGLGGNSTVANYGPPYNNGSGSVQNLGFFSPQRWAGVHVRTDPTNDFVLQPVLQGSPNDSAVQDAITTFNNASGTQQQSWVNAYTKALDKAKVSGSTVSVPDGDYGPVPVLMNRMLELALSGGLDGLLLTSGMFYQTDYTKPLLFMNDGGYLAGLAQDQSLTGNQWGMMNETGRYPGQAWLWLYTMWYQIPPYSGSSNADLMVVLTMVGLSALLVLVPFIPGVRDLPRLIPIHRLIWRQHYAEMAGHRPRGFVPRPHPEPRPSTK
ncbi:MAG: hypothetical protein JOZ75_06970 [Candidatus Dormibacteraeota bacterium]|nr:hypothetical protein [Candidatus Dormibacteraeota bacterium]